MPTLRSHVDINAPADKVFEYASDFPRYSECAAHPLSIEAVEPGPTKIGSLFTSTSKTMGKHKAAPKHRTTQAATGTRWRCSL